MDLAQKEKLFLGDMRDHNSMSVTDCTPTITPPSSPFRGKRRGLHQSMQSLDQDYDSPLEIESLAGESPPSSPEPTNAVHPYTEEGEEQYKKDIMSYIEKSSDAIEQTPPKKPSADMALLSFNSSQTQDVDDEFFTFSTPPSDAKLPSSRASSSYMKAMIDLINPSKTKTRDGEPIPFKLDEDTQVCLSQLIMFHVCVVVVVVILINMSMYFHFQFKPDSCFFCHRKRKRWCRK